MKRTVAFLMAGLMICTTALSGAVPVNAAEIAEENAAVVQELETNPEEEIAEEESDAAENLRAQEAEPVVVTPDEAEPDSPMPGAEEFAEYEDAEAEVLTADEEILEEDPEEEFPEEAENDGEDELLGDGYIELPANADAEFFKDKATSASYKLVRNSVITLADDDNIKLGSIVKENDEADYSLTIKAADESAGTGKLTLTGIYLDKEKNSLDIQGGIITFTSVLRPGRDFYLKGGEIHSDRYIAANNVHINDGLLEIISNYGASSMDIEGAFEMTGGIVRLTSKDYKALKVAQDVTISGGELTAIALNQGSNKNNEGIYCGKTIAISGDAVVNAQGDKVAVRAGRNSYAINLQEPQVIQYPAGGSIGSENSYPIVVDSDSKPAPVVRIAPATYQPALETDKREIDFGALTYGYDEAAAAAKKTSVTVTNKGTQAVSFVMPQTLNFNVALAEGSSLSDVIPGGSVTFELTPKTQIGKDKGNDLLTIQTAGENASSISIPLILRVGYFLQGTVSASTLKVYQYELLGDTTIELGATDNKEVYNIQCKGHKLTIGGDADGKLKIGSGILLGEEGTSQVIINNGTISFGSNCIWGQGSVTINGGNFSAPTGYIQLSGTGDVRDFVMTGGTLTLSTSDKRELIYAKSVTISGGKLELTGKGGASAITANGGDVSISSADVRFVTNGDYAIRTSINTGDVKIGPGTKLYAKAAKEAIALYNFSGSSKITVDGSLTIQKPAGGRIASEGDNKGHIVDNDGNIAKIVQIGNGPLVSNLTATPASLDFGRVPVDYTEAPTAQTVTITNVGTKSVTFIQPTSSKYDIEEKTEAERTVAGGGSITFTVRPQTGLGYGQGDETLTIETEDYQSIDIELLFSIERILSGTVEAAGLEDNEEYTIIGDTVIHIGSGVDKTIYRIVKDDDVSKPNLTFTGVNNGKLTLSQNVVGVLGDVTLEGGCVDIYRLTGSNVTVTGGKAELKAGIEALSDLTVSGGEISINSTSGSSTSVYGNKIDITGGKITAMSSVPKPVVEATDTLSITGGVLSISSTNDTALKGKNIEIGGNALIDATTTTTAEGVEAVTKGTGGFIKIADTVNLVTPSGGYVAPSGDNAGHIVDAHGNTVKTVRFYPVVLETDPDPVDFGASILGVVPDAQTVTITNTDARTVNLQPITSTYYEIGEYSVDTLATGESATFTVRPKEVAAAGRYDEVLKIKTDTPDIFKKLPVKFYAADPGDKLWIADIKPVTYTGAAQTPTPVVFYRGHKLAPSNYTVKYTGNINVTRNKAGEVTEGALITVIGTGNFAGRATKRFTILPKSIGEGTLVPADGISVGTVQIVKNSKATPLLTYGSYKLAAKDYTVDEPNKKYTEDGHMTVNGQGNFTGSLQIPVDVVEKKTDLKTLNVVVDTKTAIYCEPSHDEEMKAANEAKMKAAIADLIKVYDKNDRRKEHALDHTAYMLTFPGGLTDAGSKSISIVGIGEYSGVISKTVTVKPLVVKTEADGMISTNAVAQKDYSEEHPYEFTETGVTIGDDLEVRYIPKDAAGDPDPDHGALLTEGTDYTIAYSNNKAVSTDTKKATYTINFINNFQGTPALKNVRGSKTTPAVDDYTFTIGARSIEGGTPKGIRVTVADLVYNGKPNLYASAPYITVDGAPLAAKNYTVTYFKDSARTDQITKNNKLSIAEGQKSATVYVKIEGKENYKGTIADCEYKVYKTDTANKVFDLSKAKVTIYQSGYDATSKKNKVLKSVTYNGLPREISDEDIDGTVVVEYKVDGKKFTPLQEGIDYELKYANNINKGNAVLIVSGKNEANENGTFVGSKTANFTIVAKSVTDILEDLLALLTP
ncbi:MAG: hypothetical protein J6Y57_05140 [Lachnospiraceae bacterium]|nr:hypothetical protein [Lachnospiraceae bacterium]